MQRRIRGSTSRVSRPAVNRSASVDLNDDAFGDEFGDGQFGGEQVPVVEDRGVVRVDGLDSTLLGQMNSGRVPFKQGTPVSS